MGELCQNSMADLAIYLPAQVQSLARNLDFYLNLFLHDSSRYELLYMYLTFHRTKGLLVRCTGNGRKRPALYMEAENCIKTKNKRRMQISSKVFELLLSGLAQA